MANLLSYNTAQKLNVVTKSVNTATVTALNNSSPEVLQEEFRCLFGCIGKIRNKMVKLHVDPDVTPKKQPHHRIPFHVRGDVEKEFERLERLDIIEKVKGSTPWIRPIVLVPKNSDVRPSEPGDLSFFISFREFIHSSLVALPSQMFALSPLNGLISLFWKNILLSGISLFFK